MAIVSSVVSSEQRELLKLRASENDRSISWLVRDAVTRYLERELFPAHPSRSVVPGTEAVSPSVGAPRHNDSA